MESLGRATDLIVEFVGLPGAGKTTLHQTTFEELTNVSEFVLTQSGLSLRPIALMTTLFVPGS